MFYLSLLCIQYLKQSYISTKNVDLNKILLLRTRKIINKEKNDKIKIKTRKIESTKKYTNENRTKGVKRFLKFQHVLCCRGRFNFQNSNPYCCWFINCIYFWNIFSK